MTRRRLAALVAAVLALLFGAGLWAAPRLIDWESWRTQIADVAAAQLGRPVSLEGPIALVLLPHPRAEAGAVTVGDAGDGVTVAARAMRLRLDLPALLAGGRLEPREIVLVGGEIRLPWPPGALPSFRPPSWLTALDARLEECRLVVGGGLALERLNARLATGGTAEALAVEGSFAWRGQAVRFSGQLGRAGSDGVAPLDLGLAVAGATLSARGVLLPAGGFEGRMDAAGNDLSAVLPAPAAPFRASTNRFTAAADLLAADDLSLDLGGQPARGAVTLRLDPALRLDIALNAGRLDLDAWAAALRTAIGRDGAGRAFPVSVDLSAEATSLAGVPLRRLRGGAFLEGERLTLSDVSAVLPGDTAVELAGATAGARLEAQLRFSGDDLRATADALGLPLAGTDPARLRAGEGRFRLTLQEGEAAFSDLAAAVGGAKVSGAGVLRPGPRPFVGLGLSFDELDLDGLLPADPSEWPALGGRAAANLDLNLRLAAERASWRGAAAERASLDATAEAGRLALRRLAFRLGEVDAAASGNAAFGGGGQAARWSDLSVELSGADGAALAALLPDGAAGALPLVGNAVALRLTGGGPPEALALRAEAEVGDLRAEVSGTVDALQRRLSGAALTARHPGAPRLLAPLLGDAAAAGWLGQGSFSLIATLSGDPRAANAESFDLAAGELRLRGAGVSVAFDGPRPRVSGRLSAERLPLPALAGRGDLPLGLRLLAELDAEVAAEAARVEAPGLPVLEAASAALTLSGGTLRLDNAQARLGGGAIKGGLTVDGAAEPPRVALDAALSGAAVAGPLFGGLPLDLSAGKADARAELAASGHSAAAMLATLGGTLAFGVRGGLLDGYDLGAVQAASAVPDLAEAEAALRRALAGGATGFERLEGAARFADGRATLEGAALSTEGGAAASATGGVDLGRGGVLDLRVATKPVAEAPEIGLRLSGPADDPQRLPELAPFLRWRAEQ